MSSSPKITAEGARRFVERPWDEIARAKERYWQEAHERSADATSNASAGMWEVIHELGYTRDEAERDADFASHVRLKELLDRADRGRAR